MSNMPNYQSAYRHGYCTETAMIKIYNKTKTNTSLPRPRLNDRGEASVLCLLSQSDAFKTVRHQLLILHLALEFGITGCALE
jgi:hypothetical protein